MGERRERPGFALEAGEPIGIGREVAWQRLDDDRAIEPRVVAQIDDPHSAAAPGCQARPGASRW
jgi:hypothetical protein